MDTSAGGKAGRSDSVSHRKAPSVPSVTPVDSPSCRRNGGESVEESVAAISVTSTQPPEEPREGTLQSYALSQETRQLSLHRKRSRDKQHQPRQRSLDVTSSPSTFSPRRRARLSDMDVEHALYQLLEDTPSDPEDGDLVDAYMKASLQPPVTYESLAELDIARIINNPKLRHDVNFDRELHFRPNLDGSRGRHKLKAADEYWRALIGELELYRSVGTQLVGCTTSHDAEYWARMMRTSQKRIPGMFETIRDVLKTLVPERDQATVADRLDITMIMQEISKGVFDLMSLAQWLAKLLKAHCAPMRDDWIDQMVAQTAKGVTEGCQKHIVLGLRQLLGILEAMKLDVANHQIRHLRGLLIDDAINFQQRYHLHRLSYGRLDVARARRWFEREVQQHTYAAVPNDKLKIFASALLRSLLSQSSLSAFPETFQLDSERLRSMRTDLHHLIYLDICCDVFDMLVSREVSDEDKAGAKSTLRASLSDIIGDSRRFVDSAGNISVEIVRVVLQAEGSTNYSDFNLVDLAEQRLRVDLQSSSLAFNSRSKAMIEEQLPVLYGMIRGNLKLTAMALHSIMIPQPTVATPFSGKADIRGKPQQKNMEDTLRRMTHVAVLHWHVWSPLVYNLEDELQPQTPSESECDTPSPACSSDMESEDSMSSGSETVTCPNTPKRNE